MRLHPFGVNVSTALRAAMLEHVMRISSDDLDILPFLDTTQCSHEAMVALGKLLAGNDVKLTPGSPLVSWATGETLDENWRSDCPPRENCLWLNLIFLSGLYGDSKADSPYEQLEDLRSREDEEDLSV